MKTKLITAVLAAFVLISCEKEDISIQEETATQETVEIKGVETYNKKGSTFSALMVPNIYQKDLFGASVPTSDYLVEIDVEENGILYSGELKVRLDKMDLSMVALEISDNLLANTSLAVDFWVNVPNPNDPVLLDFHNLNMISCNPTVTDSKFTMTNVDIDCKVDTWISTLNNFSPLALTVK